MRRPLPAGRPGPRQAAGAPDLLQSGTDGTRNAGRVTGKPLSPPVAVRGAICALVWKKWINRPTGTLSALFGAIWRKQPQTLLTGSAGQPKWEKNRGWMAGSKCVQVKGRVAFASPPARFTPPGKAVRERKMPPTGAGFPKIRWLDREISRKRERFRGGLGKAGGKKGGCNGSK